MNYHAILIDKSFNDNSFPLKFKTFAKKVSDDWIIYGVNVTEKDIPKIQQQLKKEKFYAHLYNNKELIIIFPDKIFHTTQDPATWNQAIKHGVYFGIPKKQLDFKPHNFEDEEDYFIKA